MISDIIASRFSSDDSDSSVVVEFAGRNEESVGESVQEAVEESVGETVADRVRNRRSVRRRGANATDDAERRRSRRSILSSRSASSSSSSSSSSSEEDDLDDVRPNRRRTRLDEDTEVEEKLKEMQGKQKPRHNFHVTKEIINRQYGGLGLTGPRIPGGGQTRFGLQFSERLYSSLHVVQKLKLDSKLDHHLGCVNAIGFSNSGSILVSGSDDLKVALWNWNRQQLLMAFESGHRNNVFQCKFLPLPGDRNIATCARDGNVRLAEVSESMCRSVRKLSHHGGPCHKLAVSPYRPQVILSAGEDGKVLEADVRQERANTIAITTNEVGSRVALYSIHQHPLNENQFCVAGRDEYVCVYDRRITTTTAPPVLKYCPKHLISSRPRANVTCAVYSNNGDAILASYNDDDIYLFDTSLNCSEPYTHRYSGHRNSATVKGVNMFGPRSQYILSGSDCGNIFIWSRETEAIVNCFQGDESGVVNVLEWHPHLPVLATSGLDSDVKVWVPSADTLPAQEKIPEVGRYVDKNQTFVALITISYIEKVIKI